MRKLLLLLPALIFSAITVLAQTKTVSGKITDQKGQPIPFVTVHIKGSKQAVAADGDGNFSLKAKTGDILIITATGIVQKEVAVGESAMVNITVAQKAGSMTEVVVTALGQTQRKAKLGYSTTTFSTATINKNGATGMLDGLEGKIAGAEISDLGGPGSSTKVILRGYGVISGGDNQPLYVIDGVPLSNGSFLMNSGTGTSGASNTDAVDFGNGMTNINPNDIESLTVLKGTAASALYGSLAKNGAIIIVTKKGRAGKLKVEYDGSIAFSRVGKLPKYQDEFGQGWGGDFVSDENGSWGPRLDGQERKWGSIVGDSQLTKPFSPIPNNLRSFFVTGTEYNNSVALSGGSDLTRFYFSYSNVTSQGVVPDNANTQARNNFSLRTNSNFGKFAVNTSFNFVNQTLYAPSTGQGNSTGGGVFQSLLQIPVDLPIKQFRDINNPFFNVSNYFTPYAENPYFSLQENGDKQDLSRFYGNLDMSYKLTRDLKVEYRLGGDFSNYSTLIWKQPAAAQPNTWNGPYPTATNPEGAPRNPDVGEVGVGAANLNLINSDLIFNYNRDLFKQISLDVLAGGNYYQENSKQVFTEVTNLVVPSFFNLSNTSKTPTTTNAETNERKIGAYAQATIGYNDELFLTGNVRNDWSSTLPINHNSIFYPGANISWVASQLLHEKDKISFLKLRFAYGKTGSDPAPYNVSQTLGSGTVALPPLGSLTFPFNGVSGYGISNILNNSNLKPIFTTEYESGIEARFLNDRIGLDATVYDKKTNGQIFPVLIAPSTGYTNLVENLGQVSNKGIELTLNATPVQTRSLTWNFTYVFSRNWNRVDNLNGTSPDPLLTAEGTLGDAEMRAVVGKTVASIYSVVPQRSPSGQVVVNPTTGLPLPNATALDANGLIKGYFGTGLYTYTMGLTNTVTYKSLSLNFSLDFRYGGVMYSNTADLALFVGNSVATTYNNRQPFIIPNSVYAVNGAGGKTGYATNTTQIGGAQNNIAANYIPVGGLNETNQIYNYYSEGSSYSGGSDAMRIFSRSFLKLRDVNLSYSMPNRLLSLLRLSSATIGVFGRNFLLWTPKANVYVDPEATNLGNDLGGQVGEFATTPLTRSYGIILKAIF
jgi:TonB-linked SusC/RagA family outer membrane protein